MQLDQLLSLRKPEYKSGEVKFHRSCTKFAHSSTADPIKISGLLPGCQPGGEAQLDIGKVLPLYGKN